MLAPSHRRADTHHMVGRFVGSLALVAACAPAGREGDGPPRCGDGILQLGQTYELDVPPLLVTEQCDDGDLNGTTESQCSLQCQDMTLQVDVSRQLQLPMPARKLMAMSTCLGADWLFASSFDDRGIAVISAENEQSFVLKAHGPPSDFTIGAISDHNACSTDLVWIERAIPTVGGPWLLWARIGEEPAPIIHELPFPIPGAVDAVFQREHPIGLPLIMTAASGGRLFLARLYYPADAGGHVDVTDVGAASTAPSLAARIEFDHGQVNDGFTRNAVFDSSDPPHVVVAKYDVAQEGTPFADYDGTWPRRVISAENGEWVPGFEARGQLAMLAADGTVDIWDFLSDAGEITSTTYGVLPPQTQQLAVFSSDLSYQCVEPWCAVLGVATDGSITVLQNNAEGHALAPQRFDIGPPCTVCSLDEMQLVHSAPGSYPSWYAFDDLAVQVSFSLLPH